MLTGLAMEPHRNGWRCRLRDGAISGLAGGAAFALVQELDQRAFRYPANDYLLLGGMFDLSIASSRRIGIALHVVNSAALGGVYAFTTANVTGIPAPAKGVIFALLENTALYPALLLERRHPLIKSGKLVSYFNWKAFTQEMLRHVAFGAVTGAIHSRLSKR